MSDNLSSLCSEFTSRLASPAPVPGGGGASALCGALAAALCSMAGELSKGKKSTAQYADELESVTEAAKVQSERFLRLIDGDAAAFEPLSKAYSIPKSDPAREKTLSEASILAASVPFDILKECSKAAELIERMSEISSRIMISDVGCAAAICRAAAESAAMNVYVNLPEIKDSAKKALLKEQTDELLRLCTCGLESVSQEVINRLKEP